MQPEQIRAELQAKERAKQQRLYNGHAACVAHAAAATTAAIATGGSGAAAAAVAPAGSSDVSQESSSQAPPSSLPASPGAPTSCSGGCQLLGPATEPQRSSAEWLAAQTAYEDAHLGQFERVLPAHDPELVRAGRGGMRPRGTE